MKKIKNKDKNDKYLDITLNYMLKSYLCLNVHHLGSAYIVTGGTLFQTLSVKRHSRDRVQLRTSFHLSDYHSFASCSIVIAMDIYKVHSFGDSRQIDPFGTYKSFAKNASAAYVQNL